MTAEKIKSQIISMLDKLDEKALKKCFEIIHYHFISKDL